MTLDHLGIAADDTSTALFARLLGSAPYKTEIVETQGVRTVFFGDGGARGQAPKVEMLESVSETSPIATYLSKRGPGLHHVAFQVDDIEAEMARVRDLGIRLLSDEPQPGADGKRIVFLHPKDTAGVLVELCADGPRQSRPLAVEWDGGTMHGWEMGAREAPPLVALHGALGTAEQMERFADTWARHFRVIALDLPGHGRSSDEADPTWARFASGVIAVLDALELRDVRLFGYSLGAGVALEVARQRPVARLALHATNTQWTETEVERMTAGLRELSPEAEARMETLHGSLWRETVTRMIAFSESLPDTWIDDAMLATIGAPALVSIGDRDGLFEVEHALHLARRLADARLWVIPEARHALGSLDATTFARTISDFLLQ